MGAYEDEAARASKIPQKIVTLEMDTCSLTFGVAPCTATGEECYNTWGTSKDQPNYDKTIKSYEFSQRNSPIIGAGIRPYLVKDTELATEINPGQGIAVNARVTFELEEDDNDNDIGIDPYFDQRVSIQGSFWRKFFARNEFYEGRTITRKKGFDAIAIGDYLTSFKGIIVQVKGPSGKKVTIIAKDFLKKLDEVEIPLPSTGKLSASINAAVTTITLDDATEYEASGYVRIDDEIIQYAAISSNDLTGCTRGAFNTDEDTHDADAGVQQCAVWQEENPWDIIDDMLQNRVGYDAADIDTPGAELERDTWFPELKFTGNISEPTLASVLVNEIVEQINAYIWWDMETQKIKLKVPAPAVPGQTVKAITDTDVVNGKITLDRNEKSRLSLVAVYYDKKNPVLDEDEIASYAGRQIHVDADKESENEYGSRKDLKIFSRWITSAIDATYLKNKKLLRFRKPPAILTFVLEMKDDDLKMSNVVDIITKERQGPDGNPLQRRYEVIRKKPKGLNEIEYKVMDTKLDKRYMFIGPAYEVTGTDSNVYTCILAHVSEAANQPVTGGSWATYWVLGGVHGGTWKTGKKYAPSKNYDDAGADHEYWHIGAAADNTVGAAKDPGYYIS